MIPGIVIDEDWASDVNIHRNHKELDVCNSLSKESCGIQRMTRIVFGIVQYLAYGDNNPRNRKECQKSTLQNESASKTRFGPLKSFGLERFYLTLFLCRISVTDHPRNVLHNDVGRSSFFTPDHFKVFTSDRFRYSYPSSLCMICKVLQISYRIITLMNVDIVLYFVSSVILIMNLSWWISLSSICTTYPFESLSTR